MKLTVLLVFLIGTIADVLIILSFIPGSNVDFVNIPIPLIFEGVLYICMIFSTLVWATCIILAMFMGPLVIAGFISKQLYDKENSN